MKAYFHAALVFIAIGAILALIFLSTLPAEAGRCHLISHNNREYVTVNRGPCYRRDFPLWCRRYIPAQIWQGQKIRCR